ncbi:MAG: alpha/beta fold hydrolase, partial [Alphaproteobacteria bacterium]
LGFGMSARAKSAIDSEVVEAGGVKSRVLRGGPAGETVIFLHGGVPGVTPYCSGAHIWSPSVPLAARARHVVAPNLPGFAEAAAEERDPFRIDGAGRYVLALIQKLGLGACPNVGHDEGGLIALWMALEAPAQVRSVSVVASPTAAPMGDGLEKLVLAHPPPPKWSRAAQAWALERVSYTQHHIDAALLDHCVAASELTPHRRALALAEAGAQQKAFGASVVAAKSRFYAHCRERAFPVPVQIVWGRNDPLASLEHGMVLYKIIAARQTATHFHAINRTGNFPFREEPAGFAAIVSAFHDGLAVKAAV